MLHKNPEEMEPKSLEVKQNTQTEEDKEQKNKKVETLASKKIDLIESEELFSEKNFVDLNLDDASMLMDGFIETNVKRPSNSSEESRKEVTRQNMISAVFDFREQQKIKEQIKADKIKLNKKVEDFNLEKMKQESPFFKENIVDESKLEGNLSLYKILRLHSTG